MAFTIPDYYYDFIRRAESGGNDNARAKTSSASGRYQFTKSTWSGLGFNWADVFNPDKQEAAIRLLTKQNASILDKAGIPVSGGSLYGAHFLGPGTATKVYGASGSTPLSSILSAGQIKANPFLKGWTVDKFKSWAAGKGGDGSSVSQIVGSGMSGATNLPGNDLVSTAASAIKSVIGGGDATSAIASAVSGSGGGSDLAAGAQTAVKIGTDLARLAAGDPTALLSLGADVGQAASDAGGSIIDQIVAKIVEITQKIIDTIGAALAPWISRSAFGFLGFLLIAGAIIVFASQSKTVQDVAKTAVTAAAL